LPDLDFTARLYGGVGSSTNFEYRFFGPDSNPNTSGGQFVVYPTPTDTIDCSYEYMTRNLFLPPNWLPSTAYTIGQYAFANGNIYLCDTNGASSTTPPSAVTQDISDGSTRWDYQAAPYETIVLDTDQCLFFDDIMIAEIKWRYLKSNGADYESDKQEARALLAKAMARLGSASVGSFSRIGREITRYTYPRTFIP
jgi:hypothetical protein